MWKAFAVFYCLLATFGVLLGGYIMAGRSVPMSTIGLGLASVAFVMRSPPSRPEATWASRTSSGWCSAWLSTISAGSASGAMDGAWHSNRRKRGRGKRCRIYSRLVRILRQNPVPAEDGRSILVGR